MNQPDFIDVPLRASNHLAMVLAASHGVTIIAIAVMPVYWWFRLLACALVLMSAATLIYRRAMLKGDRACIRLKVMHDGSCELEMADKRVITGALRRGWFVAPQLIVLRIACPTERWSRGIALLPDSANADDLRQLRIFLRFAIDLSGRPK